MGILQEAVEEGKEQQALGEYRDGEEEGEEGRFG